MALEHAVALKLPTFWTTQPRTWFTQTEAQFHLRHIAAEDTRYYHVLAALDQDTASRLLDLISNPPPENKYTALKQRLLETFDLTQQERAASLLHMRALGDSKPSALMDQMLGLMGDHPPCFLFKQLFLERLPEDIRTHLTGFGHDDYRQLAKTADALWTARDSGTTNTIERKTYASHPQFKKETATSTPNKGKLCFFHWKFGTSAKKCQEPCAWTGKGQASHQ
jgi:uncharacterized protein (DUF2249 family)